MTIVSRLLACGLAMASLATMSSAMAKACLPSHKQLEALSLKAEAEGKGAKARQAPVVTGGALRPPANLKIAPRQRDNQALSPCKDEDVGLPKK
jgi:hypothetical protein